MDEFNENQIEKQQLNDTYLQYAPDNGSENAIINQTLTIQIPRGPEVLRMNCGQFKIDLQLKISTDKAYVVTEGIDEYIGLINAATIFENSYISSDNKNFWTESHSQIQSRFQQFPKSQWYLSRMYGTYLNIEDCERNNNLIIHKLTATEFSGAVTKNVKYKIIIPIPDIFPCFQNCQNLYTSALNSDIRFSLKVSTVDKFICLIRARNGEVFDIQPLDIGNSISVGDSTEDITLSISNDSDTKITDFKINIPAHVPTETERVNLINQINNNAIFYNFKCWDIKSEKINLQSRTAKTIPTGANNLYGIAVAFTHNNSNVVFDKPFLKDIECSLSETYKLANKRVDTSTTYYYNNSDVGYHNWKNLELFFGQDGFKNINRFDKSILKDYKKNDPTNTESLGSYFQFFKCSCGNMLGVSSDFYQTQNIYKCSPASTTAGELVNNRQTANLIMARLSMKILIYKNGSLSIITPFSNELDMRNIINNSIPENKNHGLGAVISSLIPSASNLVGNIVSSIGNKINRIRAEKNNTYAYSVLGKSNYEKHQDMINQNSTMNTNKFKSFVNSLAQMEAQLRNSENGLLTRHGKDSENNNLENNGTNKPEPITLDLENIKPYYRSFEEEIGDCRYKNLLLLDYKYGLNVKLRLSPWGVENSTENLSHGLGSWLRDKWNRFKNWWSARLPGIGKNLANLAANYTTQILTGKLKLSDVPDNLKSDVMNRLNNKNLTGTPLDDLTNNALNIYRKIKRGEMSWQQVPSNMYETLKNIEWNSKKSNNENNGLLVRHGFYAGINIKPSLDYSIRKRRINELLNKSPEKLSQKKLRKIYMFKYSKEHPDLNDCSNGRFGEYIHKLYRIPYNKNIEKKPLNLANNGLLNRHGLLTRHGNNENETLDGAESFLMKQPTLAPNDIRNTGNPEINNDNINRQPMDDCGKHGLLKKFNKKSKKWGKLKKKLSAEALGIIKNSIDDKYRKKYKKAKKRYKKNPTNETHGILLGAGLAYLIHKIRQAKKARELEKQGKELILDRINYEKKNKL